MSRPAQLLAAQSTGGGLLQPGSLPTRKLTARIRPVDRRAVDGVVRERTHEHVTADSMVKLSDWIETFGESRNGGGPAVVCANGVQAVLEVV